MAEKLKCPYCGSENLTRMDGSGTVKKYGNDVMIDMEVASVLAAINIADDYQKLRSDYNELKKMSNTYAEELTDAPMHDIVEFVKTAE